MVVQKDLVSHLYRVPLNGGAPQEIQLQGDFKPTRQLGAGAAFGPPIPGSIGRP